MELHAAEDAKKRLVNEKLLLEEKLSVTEKKKIEEVMILNILIIQQIYMPSCNRFYGY